MITLRGSSKAPINPSNENIRTPSVAGILQPDAAASNTENKTPKAALALLNTFTPILAACVKGYWSYPSFGHT